MVREDLDRVHRTADRGESHGYDVTLDQATWAVSWIIIGGAVFMGGAGNLLIQTVGVVLIVVVGIGGAIHYEGGYGYRIALRALKNYRNKRRGGEVKPAEDDKKPPINYGLVGFWLGDEPRDLPTAGLVDYDAGTITVYLSGTGWDVAHLDPDDRLAQEQALTQEMIELCARAGVGRYSMGFGLYYGTRRERVAPLLADVLTMLSTDFLPEDGAYPSEREETAAANLDDRMSMVAAYDATPISLVSFTLKLPAPWLVALRIKDVSLLTPAQVVESDVATLIRDARSSLADVGVKNVSCLDLLDAYAVIQLNRNLAHFDEFDAATQQLSFELEHGLITPEEAIERLTQWQPLPSERVHIGSDYIEMDGTFIRLFKTRRVIPRWFMPGATMPVQFIPDALSTSGVTCRVIPAERELARSKRWIVMNRAKLRSQEGERYYTKAERRNQTRLEERQDRLVDTGGPALRFYRLSALVTTSLEELDRHTKVLLAAKKKIGFRTYKLRLGVEQIRAFAATLLGVTPL